MIKNLRFLILILAISLPLLPVEEKEDKSQNSSSIQHEITITATRIETPVKEIASSITVITEQEISRSKKSTVLEVLKEVLGVTILQNGPPGSAASVLLRGANSEHTLVMLDGVELNDPVTPSRSADLAHLSVENVARIEILRGPQSTLYGSDALGGVINIIPKKAAGKTKASLTTMGGSYGTLAGSADLRSSSKKLSYGAAVSFFENSGFSAASTTYEGNQEKDGYRNFTLSCNLGFQPGENSTVDFIFRSTQTRIDIDNFAGAYGDDPNHVQDYDSLLLKSQIRTLQMNNRWEQRLSTSLILYDRKYDNPKDESHPFDSESAHYKSRSIQLHWQNNLYLNEAQTLTFGLNFQNEQAESAYLSDGLWGPFQSLFPRQNTHTSGFYIQNQVRVAGTFYATAGVRTDWHSTFGRHITYRLAPAFHIWQTGTKFKATIGTGFKSPSLYQLYAPATLWGTVGNAELEPEKSLGWDLGLEQMLLQDRIMLGFTYFSNNFENLIDFDTFSGYINIAEALTRGIELFGRFRISEASQVEAGYTQTVARDTNTGEALLRRPKHKFDLKLSGRLLKLADIHVSLSHVSERTDLDFSRWPSVRTTLEEYTLVNGSLSFDLSSNAQVFLRLENILDKSYELVKGYGTPGFSVFAGIKLLVQP